MFVTSDPLDAYAWAVQPSKTQRVAVVPTMGALHEGHLSLVRRAKELADVVAVTIFVNPTQFAPHEDLARYPRPLEQDLEMVRSEGAAMVFHPTTARFIHRDSAPMSSLLRSQAAGKASSGQIIFEVSVRSC